MLIPSADKRQGIVLLVVISMLALFAAVALSFVFYAEAEATASLIARTAQTQQMPDVDPELLISYFLNQLIYDTDNQYSALCGHSLARTLYGWNPNNPPNAATPANFTPFNGFGRPNYQFTVNSQQYNNTNFINYQNYSSNSGFSIGTTSYPSDYNFYHLPEMFGPNAGSGYIGANAGYTYPDLNNVLLAAVNANGEVLTPSGHRDWNANKYNTVGGTYNFWGDMSFYSKYLTLRPHRSYHTNPSTGAAFADPEDGFADVRNLDYGPGWKHLSGGNTTYSVNDSVWIDAGFPVLRAPNGKKYKPLFAPLMIDLDNRLHLWVSGNQRGTNNAHVSNLGIGQSEINPGYALAYSLASGTYSLATGTNLPPTTSAEIQALFKQRFNGSLQSNGSTGLPNVGTGAYPSFPASTSGVTGITLTAGGSGYTTAPAVTFSGGNGTSATAIAMVNAGVVTCIILTNPGNGYTSAPTVTIAGGGGAGATATATVGGTYPVVAGGPFYVPVDFDGVNSGPRNYPTTTNQVSQMGMVTTPATVQVFPTYSTPAAGTPAWENADQNELTGNNLNYNIFNPQGGDTAPPKAHQLEGWLRYMGKGTLATPSFLFKYLPNNFGLSSPNPLAAAGQATTRARGLTTLMSWSFDRPTGAPYFNSNTTSSSNYQFAGTTGTITNITYPATAPSTPMTITSNNHGLATGNLVTISGVLTTTNANGTWSITVIDANTFSILGTGNATYNSNGNNNNPAPTWAHNPHFPVLSTPVSLPPFNTATNNVGGDYTSDGGRSSQVQQLRAALSQPYLIAYPAPDPNNGNAIDLSNNAQTTAYNNAVTSRQNLAQQIYKYLVAITGAQDPNAVIAAGGTVNTTTPTPQYLAARWLAQLSVNIVDYIDDDDYMTPFNWYGSEWLFGTELPRLVINEAYAQFDNDPNDPGIKNNTANQPSTWVCTYYNLNVWVELLNPMRKTTGDAGRNNNTVDLAINNNPVYQLVISNQDPNLRAATNVIGTPAAPLVPTTTPATTWKNGQWSPAMTWNNASVLPLNDAVTGTNSSNTGFYVIGPSQNTWVSDANGNSRNPNLPNTTTASVLTYQWPLANNPANPTIILQRLANPRIPPQTNAGQANYNPYVTVDYVDLTAAQAQINDNRIVNGAAGNAVVNNPPAITTFISYGKRQPYTAYSSQIVAQNPKTKPNNQPLNTFYAHNCEDPNNPANASSTFGFPNNGAQSTTPAVDWLVHLDRPPVNPVELFHVSMYRPHELTQQFLYPNTSGTLTKFQHYASWKNQNALIYRALDVLGGPGRLNGMTSGCRQPGLININTLWDPENFYAVCDYQPTVSSFTAADVATMYSNMMASRTPGDNTSNPNFQLGAGIPSAQDNPFISYTAGWYEPNPGGNTPPPYYANGAGVSNTMLRTIANPTGGTPANIPLFLPNSMVSNLSTTHPYKQWELLQKVTNNVTTTSNVFAVWLTVGFFEVTDDTVMPPRLGLELGRSENRQIRHRFFAIIDRSQLQLFSTTLGSFVSNNIQINNPTTGFPQAVTLTAPATPQLMANGRTWTLQPNMLLEVGIPGNANFEVVAVTTVNNNLTANFYKPHSTSDPVVCRGNMGTWTTAPTPYNPRNDRAVVPHYTVIE